MKRIYVLSIVTAGLLSFMSCANDDVQFGQTDYDGNEVITEAIVTADAFIPQTRTSISNELAFTWVKNDKMGVFPGPDPEDLTPSSQVAFTASEGGAATAVFNGSGWGLMPSRKYYAYYPYSSTAVDTLVKFTYKSSATQSADNATSHMGANDLMYTSATAPAAGNTAQFQFHHMSSISKFEITVPEGDKTKKFTKVVIECADSIFPQVVSFNPTADVPKDSVEKYIDKLTLTLGSNGAGFVPVEGKLSVWYMLGQADLSGKTLSITLYDAYDKYTGSVEGANQIAGKAHKYELTVVKAARVASDYYVDLGLPSGKKWAASNLTVNGLPFNNTVLGDYFGWGEISTYYTSITISSESSISFSWKSGLSGFTSSSYTAALKSKYKTSSDKLALEDDAAHVILGEGWCMPSIADLQELADNCTFTGTTVGNAKGTLVTSRINGKTIFLPANGYFDGTTMKGYTSGSAGARFWLTDCESENQARQQYFSNSNPTLEYATPKDKWRGTAIRPIYVPSE